MPAVVNIDERSFHELSRLRLTTLPKTTSGVVLCLKCADGKYVQYDGIVTEKSVAIGIPGERSTGPTKDFLEPSVTDNKIVDAILVSKKLGKRNPRHIPIIFRDGKVYSLYSIMNYGPKDPIGFLLRKEDAVATHN